MVDYVEALKRPFSDLTKFLIYIVISIIPIVNFISSGYLLDVAQTSMKRKKTLPEFKDYARLFIEGIKSIVIGIIYMIPVMITIALVGVTSFSFRSVTTFGAGVITAIIITLIMIYIASGALLIYADKRKFAEAFNFKLINKKIFTSKFFVSWIAAVVISGIIAGVLAFIPLIGGILGGAIGGIFYFSVMGETYSEI
jgi:hypothetical protein